MDMNNNLAYGISNTYKTGPKTIHTRIYLYSQFGLCSNIRSNTVSGAVEIIIEIFRELFSMRANARRATDPYYVP